MYRWFSPRLFYRFAKQIDRLLGPRFLQPLATFLQLLREADCGLLHPFVRLGRAAEEDHLFRSSHAFVAVVAVESQAEYADDDRTLLFLLRLLLRHTLVS